MNNTLKHHFLDTCQCAFNGESENSRMIWRPSAELLMKRPHKGRIYLHARICPYFRDGLSLSAAILTNLIQQITHRNWHFESLGQHDFNNFCNFSRLILKIGGFTPVLANHKKGIFRLKRVFLGESQRPVRSLSNQISSFRLEIH